MKLKSIKATVAAVLVGAMSITTAQAVEIDTDLPTYERTSGVSGTLNSVGSDTLNNMMALWAETFQEIYPNVRIQVEGKGSSTAPPALIEGASQLGPMSRKMKDSESDKFEKKFGYKATRIYVALDALAVFTNKDNPVKGLTLGQVDAIFSSTYKRGASPVSTWGQLGLGDTWGNRAISLYGRNSASGTYGFFKKMALKKGDFSSSVKEQPGSSAVVQGVASDLGGIGYSGIGYKTSGVNAISIGESSDEFYEPSMENCLSGDYPLARFLNVYVNKKPGEQLDKLTLEFIKFVLSKQGQGIVVKDGYFPLPASVCEEVLEGLTGE